MDGQFEDAVAQRTRALGRLSLRALETESIRRRLAWLDEKEQALRSRGKTVRDAYELFFLEYLKADPESCRVTSESDSEIVVESSNPCDTLEACRRLGLDTRKVCRKAHEKPVQAFLSRLDPGLRFIRDYDRIRPRSPVCEERIVKVDLDKLMLEAIEEARSSRAEGNKGFGALVVMGDRVVARSHDTATTSGDPSRHAEMNVIRKACRKLGRADLVGGILVSTCEPCPMCSSLAVWANLTSIVFGASIAETASLGKDRILVDGREIVDRSPVWVEVIGGILREACLEL